MNFEEMLDALDAYIAFRDSVGEIHLRYYKEVYD